ncbi:hypothetical protein VNO80_22091 [Phaseolus coccineus]|uniref:Diacylglycerol kinase accessory domain-containing protein n=1 Tax=Phaseolus coccineus TaxID=3886 RepID=A0AAN9M8Z2_PHACN
MFSRLLLYQYQSNGNSHQIQNGHHEVDEKSSSNKEDAEGVLVANIGSYMGGVDLWQNEDDNYDNFDQQSMHDKVLEVASISGTWHQGKLQGFLELQDLHKDSQLRYNCLPCFLFKLMESLVSATLHNYHKPSWPAWGIDACVLVEYASLNPCGGLQLDSVPRAGCPVVCIIEEVKGPTQARSRKRRFISGLVQYSLYASGFYVDLTCLIIMFSYFNQQDQLFRFTLIGDLA